MLKDGKSVGAIAIVDGSTRDANASRMYFAPHADPHVCEFRMPARSIQLAAEVAVRQPDRYCYTNDKVTHRKRNVDHHPNSEREKQLPYSVG
jgi:hypothetical protein